eukprot:3076285-Rhodomonas_salina.4
MRSSALSGPAEVHTRHCTTPTLLHYPREPSPPLPDPCGALAFCLGLSVCDCRAWRGGGGVDGGGEGGGGRSVVRVGSAEASQLQGAPAHRRN